MNVKMSDDKVQLTMCDYNSEAAQDYPTAAAAAAVAADNVRRVTTSQQLLKLTRMLRCLSSEMSRHNRTTTAFNHVTLLPSACLSSSSSYADRVWIG